MIMTKIDFLFGDWNLSFFICLEKLFYQPF
nr:MAG TPA: hypothetical protein [Caudoviricetes sp.]